MQIVPTVQLLQQGDSLEKIKLPSKLARKSRREKAGALCMICLQASRHFATFLSDSQKKKFLIRDEGSGLLLISDCDHDIWSATF